VVGGEAVEEGVIVVGKSGTGAVRAVGRVVG
jgi:hypothetical protein